MPDKKFDLGDYVEVKDRIKLFYELFGKGALVTETVEILTAPDGKQRVMVRSLAYRTPDDPHPGVGHSWMELPGTTPYTRGSEVENAETSSWGRAIGALGILIDRSIATTNEIESKAGEPREGSLTGTIEKAKPPHDLNLRETPDGMAIGFGLKEGRQIVRVIATGELASQIAAFIEAVEGKKATVFGHMADASWTVKKGTPEERTIGYIALTASRLVVQDGIELPLVVHPLPDPTSERRTTTTSTVAPIGIDTTEAGEADPAVPTSPPEPETPSGGALCGAKGPDSIPGGAICTLEKDHPGRHRELATDGHSIASW